MLHRLTAEDGDVDAAVRGVDVAMAEAAARVFVDAEQPEEGEKEGAPVASVLVAAEVQQRGDGAEVGQSERGLRGADRRRAVVVAHAGEGCVEGWAPREAELGSPTLPSILSGRR